MKAKHTRSRSSFSRMLGFFGATALSSILMLGIADNAYAACVGGTPNGNVENGEECDSGVSTCSGGHASTNGSVCSDPSDCNRVCSNNNAIVCVNNAQCPGGTCAVATCSGGTQNIADTCRTDCTLPDCGDGIEDAGEGCDEGPSNTATCDGPSAPGIEACSAAACGDGYVNAAAGETCDTVGGADTVTCDGQAATNNNACTAVVCGDNYVNGVAGEACDSTSGADTAACDGAGAGAQKCTTRVCGDSYHNPASTEECDSGNTDTAGCNKSTAGGGDACKIPQCGDGYENAAAGETCDDGDGDNNDACPDGVEGSCQDAECGDGFTFDNGGGTEECDDGNAADTDACLSSCVDAECGDGKVQTGVEACDDGNLVESDACRTDCKPAQCGDGIQQPGEECDTGYGLCNVDSAVAGDPCSAQAQCPGLCTGGPNDGLLCVDPSECVGGTCNGYPGQAFQDTGCVGGGIRDDEQDACRSNCLPARCGDGVDDGAPEECDDGNSVNSDRCVITNPGGAVSIANDSTKNCGLNDCHDGFPCPSSEATCFSVGFQPCDDGNTDNDDACVGGCNVAICGDGYEQSEADVEECDDGTNDGGVDQCNAGCLDPFCGNNDVDTGEECDDGNDNDNDLCVACKDRFCGDGFTQSPAEQCDHGGELACVGGTIPGAVCDEDSDCGPGGICRGGSGNTCDPACALRTCGDGVVDPGEQCDPAPGNVAPGDGCDGACRTEVCGNNVKGYKAGGVLEECDDGNVVSGDGCKSDCTEEFCGDSVESTINGVLEECDDGNSNSDDTPDACRENCKDPFCGDGVKDPANAEACDPGEDDNLTCDGPSAPGVEACSVAACGDSYVNEAAGEECDPVEGAGPDQCHTGCVAPKCGDGITDSDEQCDGQPDCTPSCCNDGSTSFNEGFDGYACARPALDQCSIDDDCEGDKRLKRMIARADNRVLNAEAMAANGKLDRAERGMERAAKQLGRAKERSVGRCPGTFAACFFDRADILIDICLDTQVNLIQNNP